MEKRRTSPIRRRARPRPKRIWRRVSRATNSRGRIADRVTRSCSPTWCRFLDVLSDSRFPIFRCDGAPISSEEPTVKIRMLMVLGAVAVVAAACGSDDGDAAATTTTVATTTTTTVATTTTTTVAKTTTTTVAETDIPTSPVTPGEDPEVDAIVQTYLVVFDSTTTYEEKEPYVTDLSGLEATVEAYASAGDSVGGIALRADEVGIDGDMAKVIYSFLFGGNPAYTGLEGEAVLTDAGWQVTREFFCNIMTSARVGCP